jgi:nicotinamide phosphoribosyltransferase
MKLNPLNCIDFYKADHRSQYPSGTSLVYSNFTPRSDRLASMGSSFDGKVVFYGLQGFMKWFLLDTWNGGFFNLPKEKAVAKYKRRMDNALGADSINMEHIEALHDLGYLPICVKALPEGSRVGMKVPVFTIQNTLAEFFWLVNYLETVFSAEVWKATTTATTAYQYKKVLTEYANKTGSPLEFVPLQGHDFSSRGGSGMHDVGSNGSGHLTSFVGTDSVASIDYLEDYYGADSDKELVGCSVPATEHSVMCMGGVDDEIGTFSRLIKEIYPAGIVSIVSDTWDFWKVITEYLPALRDDILARERNALGLSKVVIRPDSGDPVLIICGDTDAPVDSPEYKGAVECLWDTFGGTVTDKDYKVLDEHIGLIYGDSITIDRCEEIMARLEAKGFASCNVVLGIGSYTYQYVTRDTFGFAMKATYGEVNGVGREIFKDPATDSGTKKSARGLLRVEEEGGEYVLYDQQTKAQEAQGALQTVFLDGKLLNETTLSEIRGRLNE